MSRFKKVWVTGPKETFHWSYSALKEFRMCPHRYNMLRRQKIFEDERNQALDDGDSLHRAFERRVGSGMPMPTGWAEFNDWGDEAAKIFNPLQVDLVAKELAITREFKPTGCWDGMVWFRAKIDQLTIFPNNVGKTVARLIDFKTGKPSDDMVQLALYTAVVFAHFKDVVGVRAEFWWTKIKDKSFDIYRRSDMPDLWAEVLPFVREMEQAQIDDNYPAKKNGLCQKYCPVWTCQHNGRQGGQQ